MSLRHDVSRIKELTRKVLVLEALREFPDVTEEELVSALNSWKELRGKTSEEIAVYVETGCWPGEEVTE